MSLLDCYCYWINYLLFLLLLFTEELLMLLLLSISCLFIYCYCYSCTVIWCNVSSIAKLREAVFVNTLKWYSIFNFDSVWLVGTCAFICTDDCIRYYNHVSLAVDVELITAYQKHTVGHKLAEIIQFIMALWSWYSCQV